MESHRLEAEGCGCSVLVVPAGRRKATSVTVTFKRHQVRARDPEKLIGALILKMDNRVTYVLGEARRKLAVGNAARKRVRRKK